MLLVISQPVKIDGLDGNKVEGRDKGRSKFINLGGGGTTSMLPPPLLLQYNELDICAAHLMRSRSEDELLRCFYRHNSIIHIAEHKI